MEQPLDFDRIVEYVKTLTTKAQATLMYRIIEELPAGVSRTSIKYCAKHLDRINDALPDDDPGKIGYAHKRKVPEARMNIDLNKVRSICDEMTEKNADEYRTDPIFKNPLSI